MTCIEKLREMHPEWDEEHILRKIKYDCPSSYGMEELERCSGQNPVECERCWNQEAVVVAEANSSDWRNDLSNEDMCRLDRLSNKLNKNYATVISAALLLYEDALNAVEAGSNRWCEMRIAEE